MSNGHVQGKRVIAPVVILLMLIILGAISIWRWQVDAKGDPSHLVMSGTVEGEEVSVGSKVGGRLLELQVAEGAQVQAGQLLAQFDVPELHNQLEQLSAMQAEAKAAEARLVHGARPEEIAQARAQRDAIAAQFKELEQGTRQEDLAAAKAAWDAAEVEYNLAQQDLVRVQQLFEAGVTPRSQLDAAQARADGKRQAADAAHEQYNKAQAGPRATQLEAMRAQVKAAQAVLDQLLAGSRAEDIAAAQARVQALQAQQAGVNISLGEAQVLAPNPGVVLSVNYQPGDIIAPGAAVVTMLDTSSYFVQVFIPEDKLGWVQPGTQARLAVDAYPEATFTGTVTYLATAGEFTPRNLQTKEKRVEEVFRCKLRVQDDSGRLRPGMVCDVTFDRPATAAP